MDDFFKTISLIRELDLPANLHARIMRRVRLLKWRLPLLGMIFLLLASSLHLSYRIAIKLFENGTIDILKILFSDFDYLKNIYSGIAENFPVFELRILLVNLAALFFVSLCFYKINKIYKISKNHFS